MDEGTQQPPPRRGLAARMARALGRGPRRPTQPQRQEPTATHAEPGAPDASGEAEWLDAAAEELERRVVEALKGAGEELYARVGRDLAAAEAAASRAEKSAAELEHRLDALSERLAQAESRAESSAALIEDAVSRLAAATRTEDDAAQRISDAERSLLDRIDPDPDAG